MQRKLPLARPIILLMIISMFLSIQPAKSTSTRTIGVWFWVAADEEWRSWALWTMGYLDWTTLAKLYVEYCVSFYFSDAFRIYFNVETVIAYNSDNSLSVDKDRINDAQSKTGFLSNSEPWNGYIILVAFTGQQITDSSGGLLYGASTAGTEWWRGIVIVNSGMGWTEYTLQHELSHLYAAQDHWDPVLQCVMNIYIIHVGLNFIPIALTTHDWCTDCTNTIMSNRERFGQIGNYGGGGGGKCYPVGNLTGGLTA